MRWVVHLFDLVNQRRVSEYLDLATSFVNHSQEALQAAMGAYHAVGVREVLKSSDVLGPAGCWMSEMYCRIEVVAGMRLPVGDSLSVLSVHPFVDSLHCQRRLMCLVRL